MPWKRHIFMKCSFLDSLDAILLHSKDLRSLLMRKKITKNVLFKYLHSNNISFPGNSEKTSLVEFVINIWNKAYTAVSILYIFIYLS